MSLPLFLVCLWVLMTFATLALPVRLRSFGAGVMAGTALPLLAWIFQAHAPWVGLLCLMAVMSVYRKPLGALFSRRRGSRA